MSTLSRTIGNLFKIGPRSYAHQMMYIGDTKAGTHMGTDRYGNKYYENINELPLRTRWVDYREAEFNPDQIEPGWHAWMSYMVDSPPPADSLIQGQRRVWEPVEHKPVPTLGRGAFRTYSTTKSKIGGWTPRVKERV